MIKKDIIIAAMFTPFSRGRWGLPISLVGQPGIAKSAVATEVCAELGMPCEVLEPGSRGEAAFGCIPVPKNDKLTYPRPDWTDKFVGEDGKKKIPGVVFVDEITTAPPLIQAALLGLLLERRIGSFVLPDCVRIIGAYNPPAQAAGGFDLAPPLANRMGHLSWDPPTSEEHAAYMLRSDTGNGGKVTQVGENPVADREAAVMKAWPLEFAKARGLEVAFLRARGDLKNKFPESADGKSSGAWPSDRTWEMATRALASGVVHNLSAEDREIFVAAFIGTGVATEFFTFAQKQDLPNPADVLDGKEKFVHNPQRIDRTMAVMSSCTALVTPQKADKRAARNEALWAMIGDILKKDALAADIMVPHAMSLAQSGLLVSANATAALSGPLGKVLSLARIQA